MPVVPGRMSFEIGVFVLEVDAVALGSVEDMKDVVIDCVFSICESIVGMKGVAWADRPEAVVSLCPEALMGKRAMRDSSEDGRERKPDIEPKGMLKRTCSRAVISCTALACFFGSRETGRRKRWEQGKGKEARRRPRSRAKSVNHKSYNHPGSSVRGQKRKQLAKPAG